MRFSTIHLKISLFAVSITSNLISAEATILPGTSFSVGDNEMCFYPSGYLPVDQESYLYSIVDNDDGRFGSYIGKIAILMSSDISGNNINCDTFIPKYITTAGSHYPVLGIDKAFHSSNCKHIWIQDCIARIGDDAFSGASNITTITLPESLNYLGANVFSDMQCLRKIIFRSPLPPSCNIISGNDNRLTISTGESAEQITPRAITPFGRFQDDFNAALFVPRGSATLYKMHPVFSKLSISEYDPETVSLRNADCEGSVTAVKSGCDFVEIIGKSNNSSAISIPSEVYSDDYELTVSRRIFPYIARGIGYRAFAVAQTAEVVIPENILYIKDEAFSGCTAEKLIIGENIRFVGSRAFGGMKNLKNVYLNLPSDSGNIIYSPNAFDGIPDGATLHYDFSDKRIDPSSLPFSRFTHFSPYVSEIGQIESHDTVKIKSFPLIGAIGFINETDTDVSYKVYSITGVMIASGIIKNGKSSLNVDAGVYIITTEHTNSIIRVK